MGLRFVIAEDNLGLGLTVTAESVNAVDVTQPQVEHLSLRNGTFRSSASCPNV